MTTEFIDVDSAIKKIYKSKDDFFKAVKEGKEVLYVPVRRGSVYSFFSEYVTPCLKIPYRLSTPINHEFINLLRVPEDKVVDLEQLGVCHCKVFEGAACLDEEGNLRQYQLGSISQVPGEDGACSVKVEPSRSLAEQIRRGGLYEVNGLPEWEDWHIKKYPFLQSVGPQLNEEDKPSWIPSDEEESREYESMLPFPPGKDRQGNLLTRLFSYVFGVYDHSGDLVEDLAYGRMKVKDPKLLPISLHDIRVVNREPVVAPKQPWPAIDINRPEVEIAVKDLIAPYETNASFSEPYFSTRLDFYLKLVIAHWMECKPGKRPASARIQKALLESDTPFLKTHAKALSEYALNKYSAESEAAKGDRIKKSHRDDEPWSSSVVPIMLGLWRDKVATLERGIAKDAKDWGDGIKRELARKGLPPGAPTAIAALIAPDNSDMSEKYNQIKRLK